jgi:hypothetical protein
VIVPEKAHRFSFEEALRSRQIKSLQPRRSAEFVGQALSLASVLSRQAERPSLQTEIAVRYNDRVGALR